MEELNFIIKYSFSSFLNDCSVGEDPMDFVNEIDFEVYLTNESGHLQEQIGKGKISQILFSLAMDSGFPLEDVMDATHSIYQMSGVLFELDEDKDFWDKIDAYFEFEPPMSYDICFLETLEVIEKYRGKGLGKLLIDQLIIEAVERNLKGITWQVLEWNEDAIEFYKKYNASIDPEWVNGSLSQEQIQYFYDQQI